MVFRVTIPWRTRKEWRGRLPTRLFISGTRLRQSQKKPPADAIRQGLPGGASGRSTGFPAPWAGSMACCSPSDLSCPESGTITVQSQGNRVESARLSGSHLKQQVGSAAASPGRPATPADTASLHEHHLSQITWIPFAGRHRGERLPLKSRSAANQVPEDYAQAAPSSPLNRLPHRSRSVAPLRPRALKTALSP